MKVFHTNPVRKFSAMSKVIPVSIPDVGVVPSRQWIECIDESVAAPGSVPVAILDCLQHSESFLRKERQRPSGGAGNDRPINGSRGGWPPPHDVPLRRVRGGNAPKILRIVWKLGMKVDAKASMNDGGGGRILKIICVLIAFVAKIEPRL